MLNTEEKIRKYNGIRDFPSALNMEDSTESHEERMSDRPSVLADLKSKSEHITPSRSYDRREEVL